MVAVSEAQSSGAQRSEADSEKSPRFGELLLRHRHAAGLTQAGLAEVSGVSVRALSDLERGRAQGAQRRSAQALADAMELASEQRVRFLAAAQAGRRRAAKAVTPERDASRDASVLCALPAAVPNLLGRELELARLRSEAGAAASTLSGAVVSIIGHPGVGKTTLAVSAAHLLRPDFPDGCLAVDLRGMDDQPVTTRAALDQMLRALGVSTQQIPASTAEQSTLFRSLLIGRRLLVLLDNAADETQVRPLLATSEGCLTLITCRRALAGLEAASWVWLDPLAATDAAGLLASIVGADRVMAEPQAAAELVALCGNLPLAVRIAGNRLASRPRWSITYLTTQLRNERTRLTALSAGDLQVRPAFEVSHRRLSSTTQLVFRRLAMVPGADFGVELAAIATGISEANVQAHAEKLVDANLLQTAMTSGRYQFHDLIRIFARERLEAEESGTERDRISGAMLDHLLHTAIAAGHLFYPDTPSDGITTVDGPGAEPRFASRKHATDWLDQEASNWLAAQREAARVGRHREVIALARAMHWYSDGRTQQQPWDEIFGLGVAAARALGSRSDEAVLLNFLGWARYYCLEDNQGGLLAHQQALAVAVDIGDRREEAWALGYLGAVMMRLGRLDEALEYARRSVGMSGEVGHWLNQAPIRNAVGAILRALHRYDEALAVHRAVLADCDAHRDEINLDSMRFFRSITLGAIGQVLVDTRDWRQAADTFRESRALFNEGGFSLEAAKTALHEGMARRKSGDHTAAGECLRIALSQFTDATTRWWRAQTLAELTALLDTTGDVDTARDYRQQALTLCRQLGTDAASQLAAELVSEDDERA